MKQSEKTPTGLSLPESLLARGQSVQFKKGHLVFREGGEHPYLYIIKRGLLKGYYLTEDGREFTKTFIKEGGFIGSLAASMPGGVASFSLVCLEDVEAVMLSFPALNEAARKDHSVALTVNSALTYLAAKKERREYEFLCLSAEERYQRMLERFPDLVSRLTQNDVARYLGVTPVGLSRIRSRLQEQHSLT